MRVGAEDVAQVLGAAAKTAAKARRARSGSVTMVAAMWAKGLTVTDPGEWVTACGVAMSVNRAWAGSMAESQTWRSGAGMSTAALSAWR